MLHIEIAIEKMKDNQSARVDEMSVEITIAAKPITY